MKGSLHFSTFSHAGLNQRGKHKQNPPKKFSTVLFLRTAVTRFMAVLHREAGVSFGAGEAGKCFLVNASLCSCETTHFFFRKNRKNKTRGRVLNICTSRHELQKTAVEKEQLGQPPTPREPMGTFFFSWFARCQMFLLFLFKVEASGQGQGCT